MPKWLPGIVKGTFKDIRIKRTVFFPNVSQFMIEMAESSFDVGIRRFNSGQYRIAIDQFSKSIARNPHKFDYYLNRAVAYIFMQNPKKACPDLEKVKSLNLDAQLLFDKHCK